MHVATDLPSDFFERLARRPWSNDPHQQLAPLRTRPAHRLKTGELVLVDHASVCEVLRSPSFAKPDLPTVPFKSVRTLFRMFLMLNEPDHLRLRRAIAPAFTPGAIATRKEAVHEELARLLDGRGEIDAVADLGYPLPLNLICGSLGVDRAARARVGTWSQVLMSALDNPIPVRPSAAVRYAGAVAARRSRPIATLNAARGIVGYATDRLEAADEPPGADILLALRAAVAERTMSLDEAAATWVLLVIAGHETTANLIGNSLALLVAHPDQLDLLAAEPHRADACVEEVLRYESPVPLGIRFATEPVSVGGHDLTSGDGAYVLFGMANRDPDVFEDPDRFDITRNTHGHVGLGHGSHFCLGAHLARLEGAATLEAVIPRLRNTTPAPPKWRQSFATRGIQGLPLTLHTKQPYEPE
jgi:cytochrome P450